MLAKIPKLGAQQAEVRAVSAGQVAIGPITVGQLALNGADFSVSAVRGILQNVSVTVTLHISVEWHVHVGLPWPFPDIDVGDTYNLGSLSFSLSVGDIVIPGLNNVHLDIPNLTAQGLSASAIPFSLQLGNLAAEQIQAVDATLPTAGFTLTGLTLSSVVVNGVDVPDASIGQATVGRVHGDPVKIPSFTLSSLNLPAVAIPIINSSAPLDIPATLQERSVGFDAGILRLAIHIQPSALSHIDHLQITGANASATVGQIVLHDVTLPYDILNLALSQIGVHTIDIPALTV